MRLGMRPGMRPSMRPGMRPGMRPSMVAAACVLVASVLWLLALYADAELGRALNTAAALGFVVASSIELYVASAGP